MIAVVDAEDFEMYSSTSAGGVQGLGYQCRDAGYKPTLDLSLVEMLTWT